MCVVCAPKNLAKEIYFTSNLQQLTFFLKINSTSFGTIYCTLPIQLSTYAFIAILTNLLDYIETLPTNYLNFLVGRPFTGCFAELNSEWIKKGDSARYQSEMSE